MTRNQQSEVDFLSLLSIRHGRGQPTQEEVSAFIDYATNGIGQVTVRTNRLVCEQHFWNATVRYWEGDLRIGLLWIRELENDKELSHPYAQKIITQVWSQVNRIPFGRQGGDCHDAL